MNKIILQSYIEILNNSNDLNELRKAMKNIYMEFESIDKTEKRDFGKTIGELCASKAESNQLEFYKVISGLNAFLIERLKDLYNSFSPIYTKALLVDLNLLLENIDDDKTYIELTQINKVIINPTIIRIFEKFKRTTRIFCINKTNNDTKAIALDNGDILIFESPEYLSILIKCIGNKLYDYLIANEVKISYDRDRYVELFVAFMNYFYSLGIDGGIEDEEKINSFYVELSRVI